MKNFICRNLYLGMLFIVDLAAIGMLTLSALPASVVILIWFFAVVIWIGNVKLSMLLEDATDDFTHSIVLSKYNSKRLHNYFKVSSLYNRVIIPLLIFLIGIFYSTRTGKFLSTFDVDKGIAYILAWIVFVLTISLMSYMAYIVNKVAYNMKKFHKDIDT